MSLVFAPPEVRQGVPDHRSTVQALLNENASLIKSIRDYLSMGRTEEAGKYQQLLHRNLIHLAQAGDQALLAQLRDENASNDENCAQPVVSSENVPPSGAPAQAVTATPPPPTTTATAPTTYPAKPPLSTPTPPAQMMAPPMMSVPPQQTAPMPPTSQPQMGMPMGPPQGYGYPPPQGMHPSSAQPPPQVLPGGYPAQPYEQQMMYQQQATPQGPPSYLR